MAPRWAAIKNTSTVATDNHFSQFLGCDHRRFTAEISPNDLPGAEDGTSKTKVAIEGIEYNMCDYFQQSLELYSNLVQQETGQVPKFKSVSTPFVDEAESIASPQRDPQRKLKQGESAHTCHWCMNYFIPDDATKGDVAKRLRAENLALKPTPLDCESPHQFGDCDDITPDAALASMAEVLSGGRLDIEPGAAAPNKSKKNKSKGSKDTCTTLNRFAASVLAKVLYAARDCQYNLMRAVNYLLLFIHKWDK